MSIGLDLYGAFFCAQKYLYGNWSPFLGLPGKGLFMYVNIMELFYIADCFTTPNRKGEDAVKQWQCYIAGYP